MQGPTPWARSIQPSTIYLLLSTLYRLLSIVYLIPSNLCLLPSAFDLRPSTLYKNPPEIVRSAHAQATREATKTDTEIGPKSSPWRHPGAPKIRKKRSWEAPWGHPGEPWAPKWSQVGKRRLFWTFSPLPGPYFFNFFVFFRCFFPTLFWMCFWKGPGHHFSTIFL